MLVGTGALYAALAILLFGGAATITEASAPPAERRSSKALSLQRPLLFVEKQVVEEGRGIAVHYRLHNTGTSGALRVNVTSGEGEHKLHKHLETVPPASYAPFATRLVPLRESRVASFGTLVDYAFATSRHDRDLSVTGLCFLSPGALKVVPKISGIRAHSPFVKEWTIFVLALFAPSSGLFLFGLLGHEVAK